jgi:hypothetical protein
MDSAKLVGAKQNRTEIENVRNQSQFHSIGLGCQTDKLKCRDNLLSTIDAYSCVLAMTVDCFGVGRVFSWIAVGLFFADLMVFFWCH